MKLKKMWLKTPVSEEQAAQAVLDPAIGNYDFLLFVGMFISIVNDVFFFNEKMTKLTCKLQSIYKKFLRDFKFLKGMFWCKKTKRGHEITIFLPIIPTSLNSRSCKIFRAALRLTENARVSRPNFTSVASPFFSIKYRSCSFARKNWMKRRRRRRKSKKERMKRKKKLKTLKQTIFFLISRIKSKRTTKQKNRLFFLVFISNWILSGVNHVRMGFDEKSMKKKRDNIWLWLYRVICVTTRGQMIRHLMRYCQGHFAKHTT